MGGVESGGGAGFTWPTSPPVLEHLSTYLTGLATHDYIINRIGSYDSNVLCTEIHDSKCTQQMLSILLGILGLVDILDSQTPIVIMEPWH